MTTHHLPPSPPSPSSPASSPVDATQRAHLSALADGRADDVAAALRAWREEPAARQTWHAYQLIGDVMRSDDLAQTATHDRDFLQRLRTQLDKEPAWLVPAAPEETPAVQPAALAADSGALVLAHPATAAVRRAPARWATGAAAAASVAAVALVVWVARGGLAGGVDEGVGVAAAGSAVPAPAGAVVTEQGPVLRDPRLDEFLRVHQMARGGLPVGVPGGTLQRADLQMTVGANR